MTTPNANLVYHTGDLLWKQFVRESSIEPPENVNKNPNEQLNFSGNDARAAYEEVVNGNHEVKSFIAPPKAPRPNPRPVTTKKQENRVNNMKIDANVILKAVEQGDLAFLKMNLNPTNVDIVDNYGWTPLMSAAVTGNELILEFLLELGANRHLRDKSGLTAMQLAQKNNHITIIKALTTPLRPKRPKPQKREKFEEFSCSICKETFRETTRAKHEASTVHIFNTNPKIPDPMYGISKQNRGYQIMLNNGWEETRGLGPSGLGQKYPVKTILKRDRKGLGDLPQPQARVTHFKSGDTRAILHIRQREIAETVRPLRKRDRERILSKERRKERELRQALS